jgi:hypothetical protein
VRLFALVALVLGLINCSTPSPQDAAALSAIAKVVRDRLEAGGGATRAGQLLPGEWDRAEVAGPYTPASTIEAKTGPDPRIVGSGIEAREDISLVILLKGRSILSVMQVPRGTADFARLSGTTLKPDDCLQIRAGRLPRVERGSGC